MNYNFTDAVRKVLARAREEAVRLRHDYVGTEHLLLGLVADGATASNLRTLRASPEAVRELVGAAVREGRSIVSPRELPYTSRAKKVLEFALAAARDAGDKSVGPEHLLVGVMRETQGIGAEVLLRLGVTEARYWPLVLEQRAGGGGSRFELRIDDSSERSIYEQIVAQVTEGVATGGLKPGERLPTVRQLADELDIAPGTVARAYGELEREGVVVTEGARGTRVADRAASTLPQGDRPETLTGLLRPVAVAAFHLGATASELRAALEAAMKGIFDKKDDEAAWV